MAETPAHDGDPQPSHLRRIAGDFLSYGTLSALSRMANLALLPFLTRHMMVAEYGTLDMVGTVVAFLASLLRMALPSALSRFLKDDRTQEEQNRLYTTLILFCSGVGLLAVASLAPLLPLAARWLFDTPGAALGLMLGCGIALATAIGALAKMQLRMERRIAAYGAVELVETVLYLVFAIVAVLGWNAGVDGVLGAHLASACIALLVGLFATRAHLVRAFDLGVLRRSIRFSFPLIPTIVIAQVYQQSDRVILLAVSGVMGVGVFGAAARIAGIFQFALLAFRQAWAPYSLIIIASPDRDEVYRRTFTYFAGAACVGGLAMVLIAPAIFALATPADYHDGLFVVPWLVGAGIVHESAAFTRLGPMVSEKTGRLLWASVISLPVNLALTWLLVSSYGVRAAGIGTFVAEVVFTGWLWVATYQTSSVRYDILRVVGSAIVFSVGAPLITFMPGWIDSPAQSILARAGTAVLCMGAIAAMTLDRRAAAYLRGLPSRLLSSRSKGSAG